MLRKLIGKKVIAVTVDSETGCFNVFTEGLEDAFSIPMEEVVELSPTSSAKNFLDSNVATVNSFQALKEAVDGREGNGRAGDEPKPSDPVATPTEAGDNKQDSGAPGGGGENPQ